MPYTNDSDRKEYQRKYHREYRAKKLADAAWDVACAADAGLILKPATRDCTLAEARAELAVALETINELNSVIDELNCEIASLNYDLKHAHR